MGILLEVLLVSLVPVFAPNDINAPNLYFHADKPEGAGERTTICLS